jgi:hypothetical protein
MKNDFRKIYWAVIIIWGVLASFAALLYALFFEKNPATAEIFWSFSYWSAAIMIFVNIIIALGFALSQIIKGLIENPKKQIGILIGVGALILVFIIAYALASGTDIPKELFEKTGSNYGSSKVIGAGLYTVYALLIGVLVAAVGTEIVKKLR